METVRGCSSPAGPAGAGHSEPRSAWKACTETARGDNMLSCILCKCRWGWSSETRWPLSPCLPFVLPRCPGDLLKGQTMRASLGSSWGEASAATEAEQPAAPLMGPHFPSSRDFSCQAWSPVPLGHLRARGNVGPCSLGASGPHMWGEEAVSDRKMTNVRPDFSQLWCLACSWADAGGDGPGITLLPAQEGGTAGTVSRTSLIVFLLMAAKQVVSVSYTQRLKLTGHLGISHIC